MITEEEIILNSTEEVKTLFKVFLEKADIKLTDDNINKIVNDIKEEVKGELIYKYA